MNVLISASGIKPRNVQAGEAAGPDNRPPLSREGDLLLPATASSASDQVTRVVRDDRASAVYQYGLKDPDMLRVRYLLLGWMGGMEQ